MRTLRPALLALGVIFLRARPDQMAPGAQATDPACPACPLPPDPAQTLLGLGSGQACPGCDSHRKGSGRLENQFYLKQKALAL